MTIEYLRDGGHLEPLRVHTLLISTQHSPDISLKEVQEELMRHVVQPVIPQRLLSPDTQYFLNPSKRWVGTVGVCCVQQWAEAVYFSHAYTG